MKKLFIPLASIITSVLITVPAHAQVTQTVMDQYSQSVQLSQGQLKISKIQDLVLAAETHGMIYSLYFSKNVENELQSLAAANNIAVLDVKLSAIVNRLASDLSRGRVLPNTIAGKSYIAPKAFAHKMIADSYLNGSMSAEQFISTVTPKNRIYNEAQAIVKRLVELKRNGQWATKPANLTLATVSKKTTNAALILYLRAKLDNFGYINNISNPVFDSELDNAIRSFQADNGVGIDGAIGTQVGWKYLDKSIDQLITQAILNLDRTRWLPNQNAAEYIFVNLARQWLQYFENEYETLSMKTIVGRLDRQTPMMVDVSKHVVYNPTWTVPSGIFAKDKLKELQKDPGYPLRHNMKVISDITKKEVDPFTVNWNAPASSLPYSLVQGPGPTNALGFIKFPLTNGSAIYLHDTNDRYLFNEANRLRSSGCVRVERPFELGEKLLKGTKWNASSLQQVSEFSPVQATTQTWLTLKRNVPVYLFYQTSTLSGGKLISSNDPYGVDAEMYKVLVSGK